MRRVYKLQKPVNHLSQLRTPYWKAIRSEIVDLLKLGPVEVDLSAETRISPAQLKVLFTGIHKDAGIADEHVEIILTFKHSTNPLFEELARKAYNAGIWYLAEPSRD